MLYTSWDYFIDYCWSVYAFISSFIFNNYSYKYLDKYQLGRKTIFKYNSSYYKRIKHIKAATEKLAKKIECAKVIQNLIILNKKRN